MASTLLNYIIGTLDFFFALIFSISVIDLVGLSDSIPLINKIDLAVQIAIGLAGIIYVSFRTYHFHQDKKLERKFKIEELKKLRKENEK